MRNICTTIKWNSVSNQPKVEVFREKPKNKPKTRRRIRVHSALDDRDFLRRLFEYRQANRVLALGESHI